MRLDNVLRLLLLFLLALIAETTVVKQSEAGPACAAGFGRTVKYGCTDGDIPISGSKCNDAQIFLQERFKCTQCFGQYNGNTNDLCVKTRSYSVLSDLRGCFMITVRGKGHQLIDTGPSFGRQSFYSGSTYEMFTKHVLYPSRTLKCNGTPPRQKHGYLSSVCYSGTQCSKCPRSMYSKKGDLKCSS